MVTDFVIIVFGITLIIIGLIIFHYHKTMKNFCKVYNGFRNPLVYELRQPLTHMKKLYLSLWFIGVFLIGLGL